MTAFLDWLNKAKGWALAVIFFVTLLGLSWERLKVMWEINDHLGAIRTEQAEQAKARAAMDYMVRSWMCESEGVRNDDCEHFQGYTVMLVAPGAPAKIGGS